MIHLPDILNNTISVFTLWYIVTYAGVMLSMIVDLITGVHKARELGIARTSTGYKMTCDKAEKYFLPMVCLSGVDILASPLLPVPAFTMALGAFNIFCEWTSVMEKTHEKEELRRASRTVNAVIDNKDDLAHMIGAAIKQALADEWGNANDRNTDTTEHQ